MANTKSIFDIWDDSVGLGRSYVGRGTNNNNVNENNDVEKPHVRLFNAVAKGSLNIVNDILEKESKEDLSIDTLVNNFNCLHIACKKGYDEIIVAILKKYPELLFTRTQPDYRTTLMIAAFENQEKVLAVLWNHFLTMSSSSSSSLNNNVFLSMIDTSGNTALHYAAWGGSNTCTKYLLEQCQSDAWITNNETMTPLQFAVVKNKLDIVKYLSNMMMNSKGFTLQDIAAEQSITGYNSIHRAAMYGSLETIKYLLEKDDDDDDDDKTKKNSIQTYHDIRTGNGSTACHLACSHGHVELVKYLIENHNADVNVQNEYGSSPLHSACTGGHIEVVKLLIESQADCNLRQTNGSTALHVTASNGRHDITQLLINQQGVDIFATDERNQTAIDSALVMGYKELAGKITIAQFKSMRLDKLMNDISSITINDF